MPMTPLPTPPGPTDSTSVFNTRAFAFLAALPIFQTEANAVEAAVDADAAAAAASAAASASWASASADSAAVANNSALAAAAAAGAAAWVSGTTYTLGAVVWSPITRLVYRRTVAGAGTTDPSADTTNWALAAVGQPQLVIVTGTSVAMSAGMHAVLTNAALSTATLPPSPQPGDTCWIAAGNGRLDNVVAHNGQRIMGLLEDMTLDSASVTVQVRFINSTLGWILV